MTYLFLILAIVVYLMSWSSEARAIRLMTEGAYHGFVTVAQRESIRLRLLSIVLLCLAIWFKV